MVAPRVAACLLAGSSPCLHETPIVRALQTQQLRGSIHFGMDVALPSARGGRAHRGGWPPRAVRTRSRASRQRLFTVRSEHPSSRAIVFCSAPRYQTR